jgi:DNA-binding transcriptional MerR regulator
MKEHIAPTHGDSTFRARELARLAGTTVRTIHYYVSEGLLPPPEGLRRHAIYTRAHLARLQVIAALRDEGLSLTAIRNRITALSDDGVLSVLDTVNRFQESTDAGEVTVLGLIEAAVADQTAEPLNDAHTDRSSSMPEHRLMSASSAQQAPEGDTARDYVDRMLRRSPDAPPRPERQPRRRPTPTPPPETWYQFEIEDGIELRIREDRYQRRRIHRLVDVVRDIVQRHGERPER